MSPRFFLVLVLLAAIMPGANADPVRDLYAANVAVHDQSAEVRAAALTDALGQVLVKITGTQAVLETAEAKALLQNPARYLQQYRYEAVRPIPLDPAMPRLALHAEFDAAAVERQVRNAGLPLWGRERPLTLVWLAMSDNNERQLLGATSTAPVTAALQRAAVRRGLPLALPAMDKDDATRVSFMDVWGVYEEPLLAAAERYSPDAVLSGSVFSAGNDLWAGRWTLLRDGQRQRWEISGATPEMIATMAMDMLAEHYADEFAVHSGGTRDHVTLEVSEVSALKDYAAVQSYLASLSTVKDVRLVAVDAAGLRFELDLNGTVRGLEQSIALGRVLQALPRGETVIRLGAPVESEMLPPLSDGSLVTTQVSPVPEVPVLRYRFRG